MPRTNPTIEREISCKNSPKLAHGKKWGAKGKKNYETRTNFSHFELTTAIPDAA